MRKTFSLLAAAVVAFGIPAISASPAFATSSPSLACNIQPNGNDNFNPVCGTTIAAKSYTIDYVLQNGTGTYSYAWTVPTGPGLSVLGGCTSTTDYCAISDTLTTLDRMLTATVVITQGSSHTTLSATAVLNAVCGDKLC
jgi:hypothetical protein